MTEGKKKGDSLIERVNRAKARWLKRVMYESSATPMQKCFAFVVCDYLNCVTLDCWPSFQMLAARFRCDAKTIKRAARGLERLGLLKITRLAKSRGYRFAPVFSAGDDILVPPGRQGGPKSPDTNVQESFLSNLLKPNSREPADQRKQPHRENAFRRAHRGSIEIKLAELFGVDGLEVLGRLAKVNDKIIDLLCNAYVARALTDREIAAARLAAAQVLS